MFNVYINGLLIMSKPIMNVPGIKNAFLRRLWILPLALVMLTLAIVLTVFHFFQQLLARVLMVIADSLDEFFNMVNDTLTMFTTVWKGEDHV